MIQITETAQKHFFKLLSNQKPNTQIRILVINPGTYNAKCNISYCSQETIKNTDIKLQFHLISAYIDPISKPYLQNAKIDLITNQLGSHLTLEAPNIKNTLNHKIKKNIPLMERIKHILDFQINPQLKNHGGEVKLINITKDLFVILEFKGSCNGCSMVPYTLKEGIEKILMNTFPELKGIKDITEHKHGSHSFY